MVRKVPLVLQIGHSLPTSPPLPSMRSYLPNPGGRTGWALIPYKARLYKLLLENSATGASD